MRRRAPREAPRPTSHLPSQHDRDKGWTGWDDRLGTGAIANADRQLCSFTRARRFARGLGLRSSREWTPWCAGLPRPQIVVGDAAQVVQREPQRRQEITRGEAPRLG